MLYIAGLFFILGVLVKYGKLYFLLAGYNTLSKEEKEKYNIAKIASVFRNAVFLMAGMIVLGYFMGVWFDNPKIEKITFFIAILFGLPYLLITSNLDTFKNKD